MTNSLHANIHVQQVPNFQELISASFHGDVNAICWNRKLAGDFAEIIDKIERRNENMVEITLDELRELDLSREGDLARETLIQDLKFLKEHGKSPVLNIIENYERDDSYPFFPTDVYSFHVDRSPIPSETYLCTYFGASSEIIPNSEAMQKILIPEIRAELKKLYGGKEDGFEAFLSEYFFDLHYQVKSDGNPISLGVGNLWKLAIDHPESEVLPCVHRAPKENDGEMRLMIIC